MWESGVGASSKSVTVSVVVLCSPATNHVSMGIRMPLAPSTARTPGSFRASAARRALTSPACPPQAPQSSPEA
jgi:hypothetical protein